MKPPTLVHRESGIVLENLWACHECQMIGTKAEARAHSIVHDHEPEELTAEDSAEIRKLWMEDSAKRAAGFMLAARRRGPFDAVVRALEAEDSDESDEDGHDAA